MVFYSYHNVIKREVNELLFTSIHPVTSESHRTARKPTLLFAPPLLLLKLKAPAFEPLSYLPPRMNHGLSAWGVTA